MQSLLRDIRTNFANIAHMRQMWADDDTAIRVTSRSICALFARCLLHKQPLEGADLSWLHGVTGESSHEIYNRNSRGSFASLDLVNLKSFVHNILPHQEGVEDLPAEHTTSFTETLAILMGAGTQAPFNYAIFSQGISDLIVSMEEDGPQSTIVATKLRHMFLDFLQPPAASPMPSPSPAPAPTPTPGPARRPTL